jgi:hypothetical protein
MKRTGAKIHPKPVFDADGYQTNLDSLNGEPLPDLTTMQAKPFRHGGPRPGSGRKPSGNQPILLRLSPRTIAGLKRLAKLKGQGNSAVADELLEAALVGARKR